MKIRSVTTNNRKNEFSVITRSGVEYSFPYSEADPRPSSDDHIERVFVDKELGNEAFTFILESEEDPQYLADLLTYKLSLEAQKLIESSELSRRQVAKRLRTSVPQLYRLLDPTNTRKSMEQLVALLHILNCDVNLVVKKRAAA